MSIFDSSNYAHLKLTHSNKMHELFTQKKKALELYVLCQLDCFGKKMRKGTFIN